MTGGDGVRDGQSARVVRTQPRRSATGKRLFDILVSTVGLLGAVPVLAAASLFIWLDDRSQPLYLALRVGWRGRPFRMVKLRSMVVGADKKGGDSTAESDTRITRVGRGRTRSAGCQAGDHRLCIRRVR
jgi:lipopolysaccharide/colanic/teichoic acid biosynthesis glycosyltransferase